MIMLFIIQLLTGSIIFFIDPKQGTNRWVAFDLLLCSLWDISYIIKDNLMPYLQDIGLTSPIVHEALWETHKILEFTGEILSPYAGLMFALVYSEIAGPKLHKILRLALLAPCIYMAFITPFIPDVRIDYRIMVWWVGCYYSAILVLLLYAIGTSESARVRTNRILVSCIAIPPMLGDYFFNHLARAFNYNSQQYRILTLIYIIQFIIFLTVSVRYGVFGLRIHFEKQRLDQTLRAVTTGSTMLNHAMKNHLVNIHFLADSLEQSNLVAPQSKEKFQLIRNEALMLHHMIERIHTQSKDYELKPVSMNLYTILNDLIDAKRLMLEAKHIQVTLHSEDEIPLLIKGDPVHLQEMFDNLLTNGMEAQEASGQDGGTIRIQCYRRGRIAVAEITDNGCGIKKEDIPHIFQPFYSTKQRTDNFGLGLSYCYMVLRKHGGSISVHSELGRGSTFSVRIPLERQRLKLQ